MYHNQLNIFILGFGALQGFLIALLLLKKNPLKTGRLFLLLYLLTLLFQILMKVADKTWLIIHTRGPYFISYQLPFLYGPFLYLFLKQAFDVGRFRPKDLSHFLPFVYFTAVEFCSAMGWWRFLPDGLFFPRWATGILQGLSLACYHYFCYRLLRNQAGAGFSQRQKRQWLQRLTVASFCVTALIVTALYVMYVHHPRLSEVRYLFAAATFFIYWISYLILQHPEDFRSSGVLPQPADAPENGAAAESAAVNGHALSKKYNNSTLKTSDIDRILSDLDRVMQTQRPYLDPDLSIDALSAMAGTNRHKLSQVVNERLQKNFYDYLNDYRVKAAQKMLTDPKNEHLKIAAIAYDAGFNSLSTFNDVFKKRTGQTPSEYRAFGEKAVCDVPSASR
jgi:AraC-like DNA-binding protein